MPAHARLRMDLAAARAAVACGAGDPERLLAALGDLESVFEDATQHPATRRAGEMYAGRTLVYEDAAGPATCAWAPRCGKRSSHPWPCYSGRPRG